jgi:hypothetical protein
MQRKPRRPRMLHRQLDLCLTGQPEALGVAPEWSALPDQTRRTLTGLVAHLLIAHASGVVPDLDGPLEGNGNER